MKPAPRHRTKTHKIKRLNEEIQWTTDELEKLTKQFDKAVKAGRRLGGDFMQRLEAKTVELDELQTKKDKLLGTYEAGRKRCRELPGQTALFERAE